MEHYFLIISVMLLLTFLVGVLKIIATHQQNKQMINLERMHSREIAEALIGKRIDWDS